ncbi:hypothetical protein GN958_ATG02616, partial [Phytophthora infestans]
QASETNIYEPAAHSHASVKEAPAYTMEAHAEDLRLNLPLQHHGISKMFYVRECYSNYYQLILRELFAQNKSVVTVTGTPGIGISIFYGYLFNHFKRDEQYNNFTFRSKTEKLLRTLGTSLRSNSISNSRNSLYDGAPLVPPPYPTKMVCSTSINDEWLHTRKKDEIHKTLYMPLWDANELFADDRHRGIDVITRAVIKDRIYLFGNVARECISTDEGFVRNRLETLEQVVRNVDSLRDW